jgi:hypothetical protein
VAPLLYSYTGYGGTIAPFTAAPGQDITVAFYSDYSITYTGVELTVTYGGSCDEFPCSGTPAPGNTLTNSTTACPGWMINLSLQNGTAGYNASYQWQSSPDGVAFNDISGATQATYSTPFVSNTYYRANVTCGGETVASTPVEVVAAPSGICVPQDFGDHLWNVNAYNGSNFQTYAGYYVDSNVNFNTELYWNTNTSPSSAPGYQGTAVTLENHSYRAKRRGFTPGCYQINVLVHDDETTLYVDGVQVFQHLSCCDTHSNVWHGTLDEDSTVEIAMQEGGGGSIGSYEIVNKSLIPLYADADNDGFGDASQESVQGCAATAGLAENDDDCDDTNSAFGLPANCQNGGAQSGCGCTCPFGFTGADCSTNLYCAPTYVYAYDYYAGIFTVDIQGTTLQNATWDNNNFSYYAGVTASLQAGSSYAASITYYYYPIAFAIWIDFNDDLTYSANERVGYNVDGSQEFNILINCNATLGAHRMRIASASDFSSGANMTACGSYYIGEVEEYTVTITAPDVCPKPAALSAIGITYNAANLTWTSTCSETQWEYALLPASTPAPTTGTLIATPLYTATGLTSYTDYKFYVRAVCTAGESYSAWAVKSFRTPGQERDYGNHVWNVNCYNYTADTPNYRGYYVDTNLGFFTEPFWNYGSSPSSAPGYIGDPVQDEDHSYVAKRRGFTPGCYTINILGHDDWTILNVNGVPVFDDSGCCDTHDNVWTGYLDQNSTVDIYTYDTGGLSLSRYQFVSLNSGNFYVDTDGDGFGDAAGTVMVTCSPPANYVNNNTDCDDTKSAVHPGAVEIGYNLIDDDCDGFTDEGFAPKVTVIQSSMCNTTLAAIDSQLTANLVTGAQGYRWRITAMNGPNTGQVQELDTALRVMKLTQLPNYAFNTQYKVEVAVYYAGFLQPFTPSMCTVTAPAPVTALTACGQNLTTMSNTIYANLVPFAAGYRFKVIDPITSTNTQVIERNVREFRMNLITGFAVQYNKLYNVEVSVKNTDGTWLPYGNTCTVMTPAFPTTSLQDSQCDGYMVPTNTTQIYANSYPGAIAYVFQLSGGGLPAPIEITKTVRTFTLNDFAGQLTPGATYNVKVRLVFNLSDPAGPFGKTCSVTIPGAARTIAHDERFNAVAYPNPFADSFNIDVTTSQSEEITIKIYDMTGRLLENRIVRATAEINIGNPLPTGVYNVVVTQGEQAKTLRVVKR